MWVVPFLLATQSAELCIDAEIDPATSAPVVSLHDLVPALRARLAGKAMEASACTSSSALWQAHVQRASPQTLRLALVGPESAFELELSETGLSSGQVIEQIALKVAEAVRPTRDVPFIEPPLVVVVPSVAVAAPPVERRSSIPLDVELLAFGTVGIPFAGPAGGGQLALALRVGTFRVSAAAGGVAPTRRSALGVTLSSARIDFGIGADWLVSLFELGLRLTGRRVLVQAASTSIALTSARQDYWAATGALRASIWPLRWSHFALGAALEANFVWAPRSFSVNGAPAFAQSFFEGALYIGARFTPSGPDA